MNPGYLLPLANHLWQSTLFAAVAGLLTLLLRNNRARVRHWVWLVASWKFLIPFSLLITLGGHIQWRTAPEARRTELAIIVDQISRPFEVPPASLPAAPTLPRTAQLFPSVMWSIWACGFVGISISWWVRWRRIRAAIRSASPLDLGIPVTTVSSPTLLEPGVFGVFQPVLLLPEGVSDRLTPAQLKSIITHELCHIRHHDNLIAAIHMFVETVFWFHPLVWWLGKRMVEERERACDEEALRLGNARVYADAILNVCKLYLESPLICVAGVTGANLKKRIETIMSDRIGVTLNPARKALLVFAGMLALIAPVIIGVVNAPFLRAQSSAPSTQTAHNTTTTFEAASVKPATLPPGGMFIGDKVAVRKADGSGFSVVANTGGPGTGDPGRIHYPLITLKDLLGQAYDSFVEIRGPSWLDNDLIQVDATIPPGTTRGEFKQMLGNLIVDRFKLQYHVETKGEIPGYALVVAKNGPKMKESPAVSSAAQGNAAPEASSGKRQIGPDGFPIAVNSHPGQSGDAIQSIPGNRHKVVAWQLTMDEFARDLAHVFKIRVVDETGLRAKYDFTMFFGAGPNDTNPSLPAQSTGTAAAGSAPDSQDFPDFFEALQWQLGLRLEARKMPAQVMVIDHVEKTPTGN